MGGGVWRRATAHDLKQTPASGRNGGGSVVGVCGARGSDTLRFDDVISDRSSRMNSGAYRATISAEIQSNAAKPISHFTSNTEQKQPQSSSRQSHETFFNWPNQSPDLIPAFQVLKTKHPKTSEIKHVVMSTRS